MAIDLSGQKFGRLTVVERDMSSRTPQAKWICKCECGGQSTVFGSNLRRGTTVSCGCYMRKSRGGSQKTHGMSRTREYKIWRDIVRRCTDPARPAYRRYGKRGITICDEWKDNFLAFYSHIGRCPSLEHSVDRIDNYKGYEPGNVRWATHSEQVLNRRSIDDLQEERDAALARVAELERELAVERNDREHWARDQRMLDETRDERDALRAQFAAVTAERDEWRAVHKEMTSTVTREVAQEFWAQCVERDTAERIALLDTIRDRIENWAWAGLARDAAYSSDFVNALRDVAAIERAIAEHDREHRK